MQEIIEISGNQVTKINSIDRDLLNDFVSFIDAKPKTIETYKKDLKQFFNYILMNNIVEPKRADVIAFREHLKASGLKPTTIQNYITAVRLFFNWTSQEGIYPNIALKLKGAKLDKAHKKDYLTSSQIKEILSNIDTSTLEGARNYAVLVLMVTGGLRTIEVSRANIGDIRAVGEHTVLYIQGKGRDEKSEYIKISPQVEKAIREYLRKRVSVNETDPLFTSESNNSKGKRLSTRTISKIVKDAFRNSGYDSERLTAHSLRHTAITLSLLAGREITEVQQFARHTNLNTTMIYNHALDKANNECSNSIASTIF